MRICTGWLKQRERRILDLSVSVDNGDACKTSKISKFQNRKPGTFAPGHKFHRPKGATAIITRELKAGIVDAAKAHGSDGKGTDGLNGYLKFCAKRYPKQFMMLLRKLMPMRIDDGLSVAFIDAKPAVTIEQPPQQPLDVMERFRRATMQPPKRTLRPP